MPNGAQTDPWASIDESVFEVPDMEHPDHSPGNSANNHKFVLGEPISALDVQKAKNPYEDNPDGEEKDEEDEDCMDDSDNMAMRMKLSDPVTRKL